MPILPLTYYPSPILFEKGEPVTKFDETLRQLVEDMFLTMYAAPGVGLAAPQVGISKRLFVMDCTQRGQPARRFVIANPEIIHAEGEQLDYEGCLSLPGYYGKVLRPTSVVVRGQDANGNDLEYRAEDLEARCVAHETDHCDGILYVRRLGFIKRDEILRSIKKKVKAGRWPDLEPTKDPERRLMV
jgi:peptide deformylase